MEFSVDYFFVVPILDFSCAAFAASSFARFCFSASICCRSWCLRIWADWSEAGFFDISIA